MSQNPYTQSINLTGRRIWQEGHASRDAEVEMWRKAAETLVRQPNSSIVDCPADISSSPCICGWHEARELVWKILKGDS